MESNKNSDRSHDDSFYAKDLTDRLKSIFGSEVKETEKSPDTSEFTIVLGDHTDDDSGSKDLNSTKEFPKIGELHDILKMQSEPDHTFSINLEEDIPEESVLSNEAAKEEEKEEVVEEFDEEFGFVPEITEPETDIDTEAEIDAGFDVISADKPAEEAPKPVYGMVYHFKRQSRREFEESRRASQTVIPEAETEPDPATEPVTEDDVIVEIPAEETPAEPVSEIENAEEDGNDSFIAGASEIDDLLKKYLSDSEYKRMVERQKKLDEIERENRTETVIEEMPQSGDETDSEPETEILTEEIPEEIAEEPASEETEDIFAADTEITEEATEEETTVDDEITGEEQDGFLPDLPAADDEENPDTVSGEIDISEKIKDAENFIQQYEGGNSGSAEEETDADAGDAELPENAAEQIDETDLNLMLAFGMDEELKNTVGEDKANEIASDADKASDLFEEEAAEAEKPKAAYEYTTPQQNKEIFKKFKKDYNNCIVKLFICAAFLILMFFYENIGLFGTTFSGAFNPIAYPVVYVMADLQIVLLCSVLVWRKIKDGALSAIRLKPTPDSISAILLLFTVLFNILVCIFNKSGDLRLFSFPMTMCVMLMLISEFLTLRRMILSFNVVASKRPKFALDKLDPESAPLETEAFYDILPDRPSIFKITKSSFVDGFFRRTSEVSHNKGVIGVVLPIAIIVSVVMFAVSFYLTSDILKALTVSYASLTLAMPLAMFLTYSMPMYRASRLAFDTGSAIIGESALDEYNTASSISFDDRDVFPSYGVKVKSVKVFGENRIDQIIYHAASVFRIVGGPLSDVLDKATMDIGHTDNVELLTIENDGIEAMVDETHVHVGKAGYLRRCGFVPETDIDDDEIEAGGDINIMYVVIDNEVSAKMYVQYHIDPDFDFMLKKLYKAGICVGIKTLDPNIDDEMLSMRIHLDRYQVKILKCKEPGAARSGKQNIDSGIVSKHSTKALLQTFALCDKVQHITKTNIILNIFAIILSVLISVFIVIFGLAGGIFSVYVVLYQFFWIIPMLIINRLFI